MSEILKSTLKTEAYFSEDNSHRYLLRKEWNKDNKKAMVIMIQPSMADTILLDSTTVFVINNLHKLGFGSAEIVNLFSKIDTKVRLKDGMKELIGEEANDFIQKAGERADSIIIAWGTIGNNSKKVKERQNEVIELLSDYKDKMYIICDPKGKRGLHPLCPSVRNCWTLELAESEVKKQPKQEQKEEKTQSKTKSKAQEKEQEKAKREGKEDD